MTTYRIESRQRRFWWPHPIYREARSRGYACVHRWLPFARVTVDYKWLVGEP
jgi:hypothetical protein